MVTEQPVRLLHTTQSKYNELEQKLPNTLYYITDTRKIYKGDTLFSSNVEIVTTLPTTGVINCIYIVSTDNTMYYWKDDTFHLIPLGSVEVPGEENEILLSDGEGLIKHSDFFIEPSLYEYPLTQPFIIRNEIAFMNLQVTGLKVEDVTDPLIPVTVYDMLTDSNFESINTTSSPVYCSSVPTIATSPRSLKLDLLLGSNAYQNQTRAIYYRRSNLDPNKTYKFTISVNGGGHQVAISDGTSRSHVQSTLLGDRIIFYVNDSTRRMNIISTEKHGTLVENTILCGDKTKKTPSELDTTHFLALSGKARITAHDYATIDATDTARLALHGNANVDIDGNARVAIHEYANVDIDRSGKVIMHGGTIDIAGGYLKMDDRSCIIDMDSSPGSAYRGGLYLTKQSVGDNGPRVFFNNNCQFLINGYSAPGPYFRLNPGQLFIGGTTESLNMTPTTTPPEGGTGPVIAVDGASAVLIGRGTSSGGDTPSYAGKTWVKIAPNDVNDVCQLHLTGNIFIQHSGNSHEEMHDDSIFIMKKAVPITTITTAAGRALYESKNLAVANTNVYNGTAVTARSEVKTLADGIVRNRPTNTSNVNAQPALYNAATGGTRLAGTNTNLQIFSYNTTANTSFWAGTYGNVGLNAWEYTLRSNVPFTVVRQGGATTDTNITYELPEGATGVFWEDLTPEEQLYWIELASNGHPKVPGSPKFEMMGDSEIALRSGCTITGNETGIKVNNKEVATNYVVDSENTATVEYLYNQLQLALARIEALENV